MTAAVVDAATARTPVSLPAGRTRVARRALERIALAAAADALGAPARRVAIALTDDDARLHITVTAPIRMPRPEESLLALASNARESIGERVAELTGSVVAPVEVRITGLVGDEARRSR
jgi:hypothetical protein